MRRLHLNFIKQKPDTPVISWLLLTNGIVLSALIIWQYNSLENQIANESSRLDQLTQERGLVTSGPGVIPGRDAAMATTPDQKPSGGRATTALTTPHSVPIDRLIAALEASRPSTVALLDIEADAKSGQATLIAQTKSPQQMLDYAKRLRENPALSNVTINRHTTVESGSQRPIQFTVRLTWN